MVIDHGPTNANNTEGAGEAQCLKSEAISNGVPIANGNYVVEGDSDGVECIRTYKRRKHVKSSSESKVQDDCRAYVEVASHFAVQAGKEPCDVAVGNTFSKQLCLPVNGSDNNSLENWGNVVLKHLYQSLNDDKIGMERYTWEGLIHHPKISCATTVENTRRIDKGGQECSLQLGFMSHRLQNEANGHADGLCNGCSSSSDSDGHGMTEMCQNVLSNIVASENFSSLCKVLAEHFQGTKPESVLDFSVINSRMKEQAYEQSPSLFLSDIQQIWRKLQDAGDKIASLAKSLSNMSRTSYHEQVGVSGHNTFEDEMKELCNQESDSHMKPEKTEDSGMQKICTCKRCGDKADGVDRLVCDSCEEMYHVSCIEPAVKVIPHKSWYCANCAASGIGSPDENCVVCEKVNVQKTLYNTAGDESLPTNEGTLNELEENSNCTYAGVPVPRGEKNNSFCKICGNEVDDECKKICGHSCCPNKFYHLRCLTMKQLMSYGPCWFCPSCLCQFCLADKDDDQIVLCDGCDHAYHIYCMQPPRTSIPKGKWFCRKCNAGIQAIRRAKKAYESNKLRKTGQNGSKPTGNLKKIWNIEYGQELEKGEGMDMLLTAAKTLNNEDMLLSAAKTTGSEENSAAIEIQ